MLAEPHAGALAPDLRFRSALPKCNSNHRYIKICWKIQNKRFAYLTGVSDWFRQYKYCLRSPFDSFQQQLVLLWTLSIGTVTFYMITTKSI